MTKPGRYLLPMLLFVVAVGGVVYVLFQPLQRVFQTNPVLNAAIIVVLWIGILQVLGRVLKLAPEIKWAELRRRPEPGLAIEESPTLLAPMAAMLGDRHRVSLSPGSARALLDSIGARLEESREITRYLIGLLIFLGLLGTFWGLLDTVGAVSDVIKSLSIGSGDATKLFADLQAGLRAPLSGMGTAFGSSLFGLSGSLALGFLDLLAGQAQNRFYNELEEWIAGITELGDVEVTRGGAPDVLRGMVEQTADRLDNVARALATVEGGRARLESSLATLADRLGAIAERFAAQEQLTRRLAERQLALEPVLQRLSAPAGNAPASADTTRAGLEHLRGIERTLDRLARAVEQPPPPPPMPVVPPAVQEVDQQALAHLQRLDESMRQLVQLNEAQRPAGLDEAARRHLASIDAALQRLAALGAVAASGHVAAPSAPQPQDSVLEAGLSAQLALIEQHLARIADQPPPAAAAPQQIVAAPANDERVVAQLHGLDETLRQVAGLVQAIRPDAIAPMLQEQLAQIDHSLRQIAATPPPSPSSDERVLGQLHGLETAMRQLAVLVQEMRPEPMAPLLGSIDRTLQQIAAAGPAAPATSAAPASPASDERIVGELQNLDDTLRHVTALVQEMRPEPMAPMLQEHLASIDQALQRIAAISADPIARLSAAPGAIDDGAMLTHLAAIEQHLQHLARDAGQVQHRIAAEVRGELRSFAQSLAAMVEEPPPTQEP